MQSMERVFFSRSKLSTKNGSSKGSRQSGSGIRPSNSARLGQFLFAHVWLSMTEISRFGISLVCLPVASPHLHPIESVWGKLKHDLSPISTKSADHFRALVEDTFLELTGDSDSTNITRRRFSHVTGASLGLGLLPSSGLGETSDRGSENSSTEACQGIVQSLLARMTDEEKVGQCFFTYHAPEKTGCLMRILRKPLKD